jgi:hypothetical protein
MDFVFLSPGAGDYARTVYEASTGTRFPKEAQTVHQVVRYIIGICTTNEVVARRIRIVSHGSPGQFHVGTNRISLDTLHRYEKPLRTLQMYLLPSVASLEIFACKTGQSPGLVAALSTLLEGIPVKAYAANQNGSKPGGTGPAVVCRNGKCRRA